MYYFCNLNFLDAHRPNGAILLSSTPWQFEWKELSSISAVLTPNNTIRDEQRRGQNEVMDTSMDQNEPDEETTLYAADDEKRQPNTEDEMFDMSLITLSEWNMDSDDDGRSLGGYEDEIVEPNLSVLSTPQMIGTDGPDITNYGKNKQHVEESVRREEELTGPSDCADSTNCNVISMSLATKINETNSRVELSNGKTI